MWDSFRQVLSDKMVINLSLINLARNVVIETKLANKEYLYDEKLWFFYAAGSL